MWPGAKDRKRLFGLHLGDDLGDLLHPTTPVEELFRHRIDVAVESVILRGFDTLSLVLGAPAPGGYLERRAL
jgi:hypothetical protein